MNTSDTDTRSAPSLAIIVPCFNEQAVLPVTCQRLLGTLEGLRETHRIAPHSRIYLIDDGSTDATWDVIEQTAAASDGICGIKLSRNFGHQNALLAGLLSVDEEIAISIDADLQDDIGVIEQMIDAYRRGHDVVYGVRRKRDADSLFKRMSAQLYYRLLRAMGISIEYNSADFRLVSHRVLRALRDYGEVNLFLRGIIPTIGFTSTTVLYDRVDREHGETKYPIGKMLALAVDGITSFSALPLRMIALLGLIIFIGSLALSAWVLWIRLVSDIAIPGWASSVLPMYFLGGIQLLSIGVLGEYASKIYMETKRRPRFIIEKTLD
ncbi:MAG: glycosyltransferase family 2 protein [Gammaproteobacteria bacterium]|nr:glycosyltransferase family 2 protein [Gammaproteobacteria bacterium]